MSINQSLTNLASKPEQYFSQRRLEMTRFIPATAKRILDVGCGEGLFASQLKQSLAAEIWGIELAPSIARVAAQRLDRVLCGDVLEQLQDAPENYFDCVVFNDVIEHLVDPYQVLRAVKRNLTRSGVIVASIPNIRYFPTLFDLVIRGKWTYEDQGILDKTHLRFFTKKSIEEMFQTLGYHILSLDGINKTQSQKMLLFNLLTLGRMSDILYVQFACVAQPIV